LLKYGEYSYTKGRALMQMYRVVPQMKSRNSGSYMLMVILADLYCICMKQEQKYT